MGNFTLSIRFSPSHGENWWLTGVYGPCRYRERGDFWEELASLYGLCRDNWCLGGDFNIVRFPSEKKGEGGNRITKGMRDFDAFINETNLRDPNVNNVEFTCQMADLILG